MANQDFDVDDGFDPKAAKAKLKEEADNKPGKYTKFAEGSTVMRILPGRKGIGAFVMADQHSIDIPGIGQRFYNCPRMEGRDCKQCDTADKLVNSRDANDRDRGFRLKAKRSAKCNAVVRGLEHLGMRLWPMSAGHPAKSMYSKLVAQTSGQWACDFTNIYTGRDIEVVRTGSSDTDTSYTLNVSPVGTPLADSDERIKKLLDLRYDLREELFAPTPQEFEDLKAGKKGLRIGDGRPLPTLGAGNAPDAPRAPRQVPAAAPDPFAGRMAPPGSYAPAPPPAGRPADDGFGADDDDTPF